MVKTKEINMDSIRELLGMGTWFGMEIPFFANYHIPILAQTPGGFFVFGCLIAAAAKLGKRKPKGGCKGCPAAAGCHGGCAGKED